MVQKQMRCRVCRRVKYHTKIGPYRVCKECRPRWKARQERKRLLRAGLRAAYDRLTTTESPACYICGFVSLTRRLSVDHDHRTGDVRGLLCYRCNYGLSWFRDDPARFEAAARYLQRKADFKVPGIEWDDNQDCIDC